MENSYTETSPLFSYTNNNKNSSNNGVAATINRLNKDSFATSLTQIVDAVTTDNIKATVEDEEKVVETKITENTEEITNLEKFVTDQMVIAQEHRRSLLDALIKALTNFTSAEEDAEAALKLHLRRLHSSKSYECLRSEFRER